MKKLLSLWLVLLVTYSVHSQKLYPPSGIIGIYTNFTPSVVLQTHQLKFNKDGLLTNKISALIQEEDKVVLTVEPPDPSERIDNINKIKAWDSFTLSNYNAKCNTDIAFKELFNSFAYLTTYSSYITSSISGPRIVYARTSAYLPVEDNANSPYTLTGNVSIPSGSKTHKTNIVRDLPDNNIIVEHLKKTKQHYKWFDPTTPTFQALGDQYSRFVVSVDSLLVVDSTRYIRAKQPFNVEVLRYLVNFAPYKQVIDETFKDIISQNQEWLKSWLWYTGGEVKLNPFPHYNTTLLLKQVKAQKRLIEERINLLKSSVASGTFQSFSNNEAALMRLSSALIVIDDELAKIKSDSTTSARWIAKVSKKSEVLYEADLPVSKPDAISWLVNYNYNVAKKTLMLQTLPKEIPLSTAEVDRRSVLVHNVPNGIDIDLKASEIEKPENLQTNLQQSLQPLATQLRAGLAGILNINKLMTSLAPILSGFGTARNDFGAPRSNVSSEAAKAFGVSSTNLNSSSSITTTISVTTFFDNLKKAFEVFDMQDVKTSSDFASKFSSIHTSARDANCDEYAFLFTYQTDIKLLIDEYDNLIKEYRITKQKFDWLAVQTVPLLEIKEFKPSTNPNFRTIVKYPEDSLTSQKTKEITYRLLLGKTELTKSIYKKHELIRWWPAMGGVWVCGSRYYNSYDAATGAFKEESISQFEAIVGVKLYPWKTNIGVTKAEKKLIRTFGNSYNGKRGNGFLNKLFVFGGLGVSKNIFKNYCLGAGIDIVPGLSLQGGRNFIAKKSYNFDKGQVKNEYEHFNGNWYFGVSLDPGIVGTIVSLFR